LEGTPEGFLVGLASPETVHFGSTTGNANGYRRYSRWFDSLPRVPRVAYATVPWVLQTTTESNGKLARRSGSYVPGLPPHSSTENIINLKLHPTTTRTSLTIPSSPPHPLSKHLNRRAKLPAKRGYFRKRERILKQLCMIRHGGYTKHPAILRKPS
jgi:hypothetical protein